MFKELKGTMFEELQANMMTMTHKYKVLMKRQKLQNRTQSKFWTWKFSLITRAPTMPWAPVSWL